MKRHHDQKRVESVFTNLRISVTYRLHVSCTVKTISQCLSVQVPWQSLQESKIKPVQYLPSLWMFLSNDMFPEVKFFKRHEKQEMNDNWAMPECLSYCMGKHHKSLNLDRYAVYAFQNRHRCRNVELDKHGLGLTDSERDWVLNSSDTKFSKNILAFSIRKLVTYCMIQEAGNQTYWELSMR